MIIIVYLRWIYIVILEHNIILYTDNNINKKELIIISKIIFIGMILLIGFCILSLIVFNKDIEKKMKNREKIEYIKFSSKTIFNENIDSSIFLQKNFTMVNIWATYCSACIKELADLQVIYDEFKDDNIGVLGIVSDLKEE